MKFHWEIGRIITGFGSGLAIMMLIGCATQTAPNGSYARVYDHENSQLNAFLTIVRAQQITSQDQARNIATRLAQEHTEYASQYLDANFDRAKLSRDVTARMMAQWEYSVRDVQSQNIASLIKRAQNGEDLASVIRSEAEKRVNSLNPQLSPRERAIVVRETEMELRQNIERSLQDYISEQRKMRIEKLAQLSVTNLADMPREVRIVAEQNIRDVGFLSLGRPSSRPSPQAIRAEEESVREATIKRLAEIQASQERIAASRQMDNLRAQVIASCRMQGAVAGASVPTPYVSGRGGWLAAGILGAVEGTLTESRVTEACLRASGF